MMVMTIPNRGDFDAIDEWVTQVAEQADISQDIVWAIVEEFKPGAKAATESDKSSLLRRLLNHHEHYMNAHIEACGRPDADCKIQLFVKDEAIYEFQYPTHNAIKLDKEQKEVLHDIIADEDMGIQAEGEHFIAAFLRQGGVDENLRTISRVLREVYESSIVDIEQAIEIRDADEFTWTDTEELQENIEHITRTGIQCEERGPSGTGSRSKRTDVQQQVREYDSWIFCQKCGDRIESPNENPRFCSECRD